MKTVGDGNFCIAPKRCSLFALSPTEPLDDRQMLTAGDTEDQRCDCEHHCAQNEPGAGAGEEDRQALAGSSFALGGAQPSQAVQHDRRRAVKMLGHQPMAVFVDQDRDEDAADPDQHCGDVVFLKSQHSRHQPEEGMNANRDVQEAEPQVVRSCGRTQHGWPRARVGNSPVEKQHPTLGPRP